MQRRGAIIVAVFLVGWSGFIYFAVRSLFGGASIQCLMGIVILGVLSVWVIVLGASPDVNLWRVTQSLSELKGRDTTPITETTTGSVVWRGSIQGQAYRVYFLKSQGRVLAVELIHEHEQLTEE